MLSYAFGPFTLVPAQQSLKREGEPVRIGGRALDLLAALVERPGETVPRTELWRRGWPDRVVEESNLKVTIAALRKVLGEGQGGARYIATVSGRGYRFVAPVSVSGGPEPPLRGASENLPSGVDHIFGRDAAVDAIATNLSQARLVTILGTGGIGKTTVAVAVARQVAAGFRDGVFFVDLASLNDADRVPATIATALGLGLCAGDATSALATLLRERHAMLLLDNCEHLIDAVALCADALLADAPYLHVLATSREILRVCGERVFQLQPLDFPVDAAGLSAADALAYPAVALFVERAAQHLEGYALREADVAAITEICRRLDGLALAIELAAARLDALGAADLLDRLDRHLSLPAAGRDAPTRHHTLIAALDWSFDLLNPAEQAVLRRLSVFAGSFSLDSACALAVAPGEDGTACVGHIASLVAKSLAVAGHGAAGTQFRLLDTTRRYALGRLEESGELPETRRCHAGHMRDLAEQASVEWTTRPTADWFALYGRRIDDIRSALGWAAMEGEAGLLVSLTVASIAFWEHLSLLDEGRTAIEQALADDLAPFRDDRADMKLCTALGTALLHTRGPVPGVRLAWQRALDCAERLGDTEYQLRCLWGLADCHAWAGEHRAALSTTERLRALAMARGDSVAHTNVDRQAGAALRYLGEYDAARSHLERMIAGYRPPAARSEIARFQLDPRLAARGTLANVLWLQGFPEQAAAMAQLQLDGARAASHAIALCNALIHTACPLALLSGDLPAAANLLDEIDRHVAEHAMAVWRSMALCLRGEFLLLQDDPAGIDLLRDGVDALLGVGFRMRAPAYLGSLAAGLGAHGFRTEAFATIDKASALAEATGEAWCMPELLRIRGLLLSRIAPDDPAAGELFSRALDLAHRQGALSFELRAAMSLAAFLQHGGQVERAAASLDPVFSRFAEGVGTHDLRAARALLDSLCSGGQVRPKRLVSAR